MDPILLSGYKTKLEVQIKTYDGDCCSVLHLNECPGLFKLPMPNQKNHRCGFFGGKELYWKMNETHTVPVRCNECIERELDEKERMNNAESIFKKEGGHG